MAPAAAALASVDGVHDPDQSGSIVRRRTGHRRRRRTCARERADELPLGRLDAEDQRLGCVVTPGQDETIQLGGGSYVSVNHQIQTANSLTERVLDVHLQGLADIVVGEAKVTSDSRRHVPDMTRARHANPSVDPCSGSTLAGRPVLRITGPGGAIIIVSRRSGSAGRVGAVVSAARKRFRSSCLLRSGPHTRSSAPTTTIGSSAPAAASGSCGLGGNDRIAGQGGPDCIDGGSGNDRDLRRQRERPGVRRQRQRLHLGRQRQRLRRRRFGQRPDLPRQRQRPGPRRVPATTSSRPVAARTPSSVIRATTSSSSATVTTRRRRCRQRRHPRRVRPRPDLFGGAGSGQDLRPGQFDAVELRQRTGPGLRQRVRRELRFAAMVVSGCGIIRPHTLH